MNICGLCERQLEHSHLCPGCTLALAERLQRMPKLYAALEGFLSPGAQGSSERGHSSPAFASLPVNEAVLDLRYGGIALVLEGWRSDVQRVRGWGEPAITGTVERRVIAAARWLGMSLEWIASSYPAAGDLAREVREMEKGALSIVGALPERGRRVGQCIAVDASGAACGATIRHHPGEVRLVCPWCRTSYGPEDWLTLKHFQPEPHCA